MATIGAHCNGCGHKRRWSIEELVDQPKPCTTVAKLQRRWRCSKCGSRDVVPFANRALAAADRAAPVFSDIIADTAGLRRHSVSIAYSVTL